MWAREKKGTETTFPSVGRGRRPSEIERGERRGGGERDSETHSPTGGNGLGDSITFGTVEKPLIVEACIDFGRLVSDRFATFQALLEGSVAKENIAFELSTLAKGLTALRAERILAFVGETKRVSLPVQTSKGGGGGASALQGGP